ncbi:Calmodulin-binding protein 25 [Spatholobus suberectus]|nr:Calmodulin-binding protein 25 [Spatholobus suberectus]
MASSENVASIEPWMLRPAVTDSWLAEFFTRDADALTKALQKSLSGAVLPEDNNNNNGGSQFAVKPDAAATPTVSSLSGSDQESAPKRRAVAPSGKISKRKSRASKRSQTTYITADPANFRQMVQQVTGVRFGGAGVPIAPAVVKPEPQRPAGLAGGRFPAGAGCLPTLDTSALLLDHHHHHHQQQVVVGPNAAAAGPAANGLSGPGPLPFPPPLDAHAAASFAVADFDIFSSFPTLESWKVM